METCQPPIVHRARNNKSLLGQERLDLPRPSHLGIVAPIFGAASAELSQSRGGLAEASIDAAIGPIDQAMGGETV
jgi:hypothetical protein